MAEPLPSRPSMEHQAVLIVCAFSTLVYANSGGPDPGYAGVPNEAGNCSTCHGSTASVNTNGGSVVVNFPKGQTYVPGEVQRWIVTVTDSSARRWGFQASARRSASTGTVAGGFKAADSNTQVLCADTSLRNAQITTSGECVSAK